MIFSFISLGFLMSTWGIFGKVPWVFWKNKVKAQALNLRLCGCHQIVVGKCTDEVFFYLAFACCVNDMVSVQCAHK